MKAPTLWAPKEAEAGLAHPWSKGALSFGEQVHRRQKHTKGAEQPQEAEALLHAIPRLQRPCQDRQDARAGSRNTRLFTISIGSDAQQRINHAASISR